MDKFQERRIMLATILTAGFNANPNVTNAQGEQPDSASPSGRNVRRGLIQADDLLDQCGQVDPNTVAPQ